LKEAFMPLNIGTTLQINSLIKLYLFLAGLFLSLPCTKAQSHVFQNFTTKNGLPSNQVFDIYQDSNGYIWFALDQGICRYDGNEFKTFTTKDGLTDNTVFEFYPQQNGQIWCSTFNNRLFYFRTTDYRFTPYRFNDTLQHLSLNRVASNILYQDSTLYLGYKGCMRTIEFHDDGRLLIDEYTDNYSCIDAPYYQIIERKGQEKFHYLTHQKPNPQKDKHLIAWNPILYFDYSLSYSFDNGYNLFLSFVSASLKYENTLVKKIEINQRPIYGNLFNDSLIAIGYHGGGVSFFDLHGNFKHQILEGRSVTGHLIDHEGGVWFSTLHSGVFYLKSQYLLEYDLDPNLSINQLGIDSAHRIWISTSGNASGMFKKEGKRFQLKLQASTIDLYPLSYYEKQRSLNWISPEAALTPKMEVIPLRGGWRYDVTREKYITNRRNTGPKLFRNRVNDLVQKGNVFLICNHGGVFHYNGDTLIKDPAPLLNTRIEDIELFNEYEVYSTWGNGLVFKSEDSIFSLDKTQGITSPFIHRTHAENDSTLWICTNDALNKIELKNGKLEVRTDPNLMNLDIVDVEIDGDTLWFATSLALYSYPKSLFGQSRKNHPPYLNLKKININKADWDLCEIHELESDQNNLNIEFQAITFREKDKIRYRYKLFRSEDEWYSTQHNNLSLTNLAPDHYELILQASTDEKNWSKSLILPFTISPPYYQSWWFISGVVGFFLSCLYLFFRIRILTYNKDVVRELIRLLIKRLRKDELKMIIRENGKDIKMDTKEILYIKSANNYLEIFTTQNKFLVRHKISDFFDLVPDPLEYIRIHRSYIVRIDQIEAKSRNSITVKGTELKVSSTYQKELSKIHF
jgi:hypothetical protein